MVSVWLRPYGGEIRFSAHLQLPMIKIAQSRRQCQRHQPKARRQSTNTRSKSWNQPRLLTGQNLQHLPGMVYLRYPSPVDISTPTPYETTSFVLGVITLASPSCRFADHRHFGGCAPGSPLYMTLNMAMCSAVSETSSSGSLEFRMYASNHAITAWSNHPGEMLTAQEVQKGFIRHQKSWLSPTEARSEHHAWIQKRTME
ncbi:hypothetical protein CSIM01_04054 [Colletotrichum simmondsii]|uniref:Uncharacterized protein n=1 Tax=Colletotrichum simmondsii TaxID=703756 RepID=A0A135S680_9PEZI|nr:hypothetical protein CSIM01_04054 [Colletotrichum simmondsii]